MEPKTRNGSRRRLFATRYLLVLLTLLPVAAPRAEESDLPQLIDGVVAAYGGTAAITAARSFRQTGQTVSFLRGGSTGRIVRTFAAPDRLRVEIAYPGEPPEIRILNADRGWTQGREAPAPLLDAMRLQAARLDLPLLLRDAGDRVKDLGSSPAEGDRITRTVGLALADHLTLFVDIEVPGYRIVRSRGQMRRAGKAMEFGAVYQNFRQISGVLVATREEQYAMGQRIGYTMIEEFQALSSPDPAAFRP